MKNSIGYRLFKRLLSAVSPHTRARRMDAFVKHLDVRPGMRVIDLGGAAYIWQLVDIPLNVTIVNLPGVDVAKDVDTIHDLSFAEGDATALDYPDDSFDIVFSNSVIEHVGDAGKRADFAREVRRVAPGYFVQTPSRGFPLEPHTGIPFWWRLPGTIRRRMIARWEKRIPDWAEMVKGTTVIDLREFRRLFPDAGIGFEKVAGFRKSYFGYRTRR